MLLCDAVVKELLVRADEPGSTSGDADFCFFVPLVFYPIFLFVVVSFILTVDPAC